MRTGFKLLGWLAFMTALTAAPTKASDAADKIELKPLEGSIKMDGSSSVYLISEQMAIAFKKENRDVKISVGISGSGGGFKKFAAGETDISNASRAMNPKEVANCMAKGVTPVELPVALDGIAIVIHPDNAWARKLTIEQLQQLWGAARNVNMWSDLDPKWPNKKIKLYGPGPDSGTFDYFRDTVLGPGGAIRNDYEATEDDAVIVKGVSADVNAIGFMGFGAYQHNRAKIDGVAISADQGKTFVEPGVNTVRNLSYPISRPLYIYVKQGSLARPEVREFARFYLKERPLVAKAGFLPLTEKEQKAVQEKLEAEIKGPGPANLEPELKGKIKADGSSSVYLITEAMAHVFKKAHPDVKNSVGISGTGGGFKKFAAGETDINNASRPIKAVEAADCKQNGVVPLEFQVAWDGIAVVVHPENKWAKQLTMEQLKVLCEPKSKVGKWSDLDPKWPNEKIELYGPCCDSGTFDFFTEKVNGKEKECRTDFNAVMDDSITVKGISKDKYALGYVPIPLYLRNKADLVAVEISGDGGMTFVAPKTDNVLDRSYPLTRPLFIYVNQSSLARPEVREFVRFYLKECELVAKAGFIQLMEKEQKAGQERLEAEIKSLGK